MNAVASEVWRSVNAVDSQCRIVLTFTVLHVVKGRRGNPSLTMLTIALLSLDSVATGAIPDGCYALTPCTVTCAVGTPCTVTNCGITVVTEVHRGRPLYTSPLMAVANTVTWCHLVVTPTQGAR